MPRDPDPQRAAKRLREFIDATGLKDAEVAGRIGISGAALSSYLSGKQVPRRTIVRRAIERFTGGEVKASDWETLEERKLVARVVPFKRAANGDH